MKKTLSEALLGLIEVAKIIGVNEMDLNNANDYLMHDEYGLCYDTIVTQIYEYDIEINTDIYSIVCKIGEMMNLEPDDYSFLKELIREQCNIPLPIKLKLAEILKL